MQQPPKKKYYDLKEDAPTMSDKKREADLAKALGKENFYKKPVIKVKPKGEGEGRPIPKAEADKIKKEVAEKAMQEKVDKLANDYFRRKSPLMKAAKSAKKQ